MPRGNYQNVVIDDAGNAVTGADITVYNAGTLNLINLYDKNDSSLTNPISSAPDGSFVFYADNGKYDVKIEKSGLTTKYLYNIAILEITSLEYVANKGAANGYGGLDATARHELVQLSRYGYMPAGVILPFAGVTTPPTGWLTCDGSAINRITYADLFAAIGISFGSGDGSTTFNIPDCRGRTILGAGQGVGLTNRTLGAKGGNETHIIVTSEMPSHRHVTPSSNGFVIYPYNGAFSYVEQNQSGSPDGPGSMISPYTGWEGGNGAHNNMQPFTVANYIIKF